MSTAFAQFAYCTAVPWPCTVAWVMTPSTSSVVRSSCPRRPLNASAAWGAIRVRVASLSVSTSAAIIEAVAKSPPAAAV